MRNNIYIVDISGKVALYDNDLYLAMCQNKPSNTTIELKIPSRGLLNLIPQRYQSSAHILKRMIKSIEGVLNYIYLLLLFFIKRPAVVHLQWLPYLEICTIENYILWLIHFLSPKTKIIWTIHNVFPHNMSEKNKKKYSKRVSLVADKINGFIVHTKTTKRLLVKEFNLPNDRVFICNHGVFKPLRQPILKEKSNSKIRILQFGGQSYYKGTDIFVEALSLLPDEYIQMVEPHIVGGISPVFLSELKKKDKNGVIIWKPYYLDDNELYEEIEQSDLIVLPYREISQSGVLMLSIHFEKPLLVSDLPTFIETICGSDSITFPDFFFEKGNAKSMCELLKKHISGQIDVNSMIIRIKELSCMYSWDNSAKMTLGVYQTITKGIIQMP